MYYEDFEGEAIRLLNENTVETVVLLPKGEVDLKKIRVGKNYNLPKSENSRQPQCPPEKEKAIREAYRLCGTEILRWQYDCY